MQALWTQEEASYEGEHVRFGRSWAWPKPVQQPRMPVLLGAGGSDRSFAWISRSADGWLTTPGEATWSRRSPGSQAPGARLAVPARRKSPRWPASQTRM